jgi:hypothetical protein
VKLQKYYTFIVGVGNMVYTVAVLVKDKFRAMNDTANPKILQRIIRMFPAIQWNHQNVILFHETIPLRALITIC